MWTKEQIAYLAGIIDGEGTIYIQTRKGPYLDYFPRFQISNTNEALMRWIQETFGGLLYGKDRSKHNKNWKFQYEWYTTRKIMDQLLPLIVPYLIVKKKHAELILQFRKTFTEKKTKNRVSEETQALRVSIFQQLRNLNHRGIP